MSNNIFKEQENKKRNANKVKFECKKGKIRLLFEKLKGK